MFWDNVEIHPTKFYLWYEVWILDTNVKICEGLIDVPAIWKLWAKTKRSNKIWCQTDKKNNNILLINFSKMPASSCLFITNVNKTLSIFC